MLIIDVSIIYIFKNTIACVTSFFTIFLMNVWIFQIKILSLRKSTLIYLNHLMKNLIGGAEEDSNYLTPLCRRCSLQLSYDPFFASIFSFTLRCMHRSFSHILTYAPSLLRCLD